MFSQSRCRMVPHPCPLFHPTLPLLTNPLPQRIKSAPTDVACLPHVKDSEASPVTSAACSAPPEHYVAVW
eukprot:767168-Hanusia_phi.AAC.4